MRLLIVLSLCALLVPAQSVGVPGANDFTINGLGSGTASCHQQPIPTGPRVLNFRLDGLPASAVIVAAGICQTGNLPVAGGTSLDLSLAGLTILLDGSGLFAP